MLKMSNKKTKNSPNPFPTPRNSSKKSSSSSRFGGGSSKSRFGSSSSSSSSSSSRFGGSRFGSREEVTWTVTPSHDSVVRISLSGLGDPVYRLLKQPINAEFSKPEKIIEALTNDPDLLEKLTEALNEAWEAYQFRGASIIYPWEDNIKKAFVAVPHPTPPPPPKKEDDDDDEDYLEYDDDADDVALDWLEKLSKGRQSIRTLRAVDAAFVLNVLARTRANVLVGNTPLALEAGFLEKTVLTDDPRIVELAQATGCIEEEW